MCLTVSAPELFLNKVEGWPDTYAPRARHLFDNHRSSFIIFSYLWWRVWISGFDVRVKLLHLEVTQESAPVGATFDAFRSNDPT
jgi:hypothetical protein